MKQFVGKRQGMGWRIVLAFALFVAGFDASALSRVDPGEAPTLAANEGLLVIAVDTNARIDSLRVGQVGNTLTAAVLPRIEVGKLMQMYVVPAGEYTWSELVFTTYSRMQWYDWRYDLGKDREFHFRVEPGRINYPGDLVVRPQSLSARFMRSNIHVSNRSLPVMDWLQADHPGVYSNYRLSYTGYYSDPFPEFYRAQRAALPAAAGDLNGGRAAPKPDALPLSPAELWTPDQVSSITLSPNGETVAQSVRVQNGWAMDLIDLKSGETQRLATFSFPFDGLTWKSDEVLLASTDDGSLTVFRLGAQQNGKRPVQRQASPLPVEVIDLLPARPNAILTQRVDSYGQLVVHEMDISSPGTIEKFKGMRSRDRRNLGVQGDVRWLADGKGELRAALARRDDDLVLMHGQGRTFAEVRRLSGDNTFEPLMLSYNGELIYGLSDEGRAQRDLVVFDAGSRSITRTLFSKAGVDVASAIFDDQRNPIAVRYYESGRLVTEYFDEQNKSVLELLRRNFPERSAFIMDRSRDGDQMLVLVEASDQPAQIYHFDVNAKRASLVADLRPGLASRHFARTQVLEVKGKDGLPIEAYLTLPPGSSKHPLIVMPHGGPIGLRDNVHFDNEVQFLASLGYAVLRVNYRGSDGYGRAFREAGHRNQGKMIEDDIDSAIKVALAGYPLDERRMCAIGASYGGYSAMVSAIRWPDRFRCVVSMAGVSDRMLSFTASDSARTEDGRKEMERIFGNPGTDVADMQAVSPLYRFKELRAPLMLVHGREDARVDFEHTRRLARMLILDGRPPVVMALLFEGHSLENRHNLDKVWTGIAGFLAENLREPGLQASDANDTGVRNP